MSILEELDQKATEKPVIDDAVFKEAQHKALSLFTPLFKDEPELASEVLETPISLYPSLQARRDGTGFIGTPLKCVQSFVRHTLTCIESQHFPSYQGQVMGVWLLKRGKKESSNKEKRKAISNVLSVAPERITASEDSDSLEQAIQAWSIAEHVLEGIWHHDSVQRRLWANTSLRVVYPDGFRVWCTVPDTQKQGLFFTLRSAKMWGYWNPLKPAEFVPLATDTAFPEFLTLLTFAVLRFATATLTASTKMALSATLEEVFQFAHRSMSGGVPSTSLVYDYIWRDEGKRVTNFEAQETAQSFKEAGLIDKLETVQIESLAKRASKPTDYREWEAAKKRLEYKVSRSTSTPSVEDVVTNLSIQRTKKQVLWSSQYEAKQKQSESEEATSPEQPFVQKREPLWWYDDSTD